MPDDFRECEIQTAAVNRLAALTTSLANSLIYTDRYASIRLARLILAGEDSACRQFVEAVVERLQRWPKNVMSASAFAVPST